MICKCVNIAAIPWKTGDHKIIWPSCIADCQTWPGENIHKQWWWWWWCKRTCSSINKHPFPILGHAAATTTTITITIELPPVMLWVMLCISSNYAPFFFCFLPTPACFSFLSSLPFYHHHHALRFIQHSFTTQHTHSHVNVLSDNHHHPTFKPITFVLNDSISEATFFLSVQSTPTPTDAN